MNINNFYLLEQTVKKIIENPGGFVWSIQGLGMLRTYMSPDVRLHIWHPLAVEADASQLHTHPWDFDSLVIAGQVTDHVYVEADPGEPHMKHKILCGEGGGPVSEPEACNVQLSFSDTIAPSELYSRMHNRIHRTEFVPGTVTMVRRFFREDTDHAYVYWKESEQWGTAEPRVATEHEVETITQEALRGFLN